MPGGGEAPSVVCSRVVVDEHQGVGEDHNAAEQEPAHELEKYVKTDTQANQLILDLPELFLRDNHQEHRSTPQRDNPENLSI